MRRVVQQSDDDLVGFIVDTEVHRDFDECECGDYRHQHKDGTGACALNWSKGGPHGPDNCLAFRLVSGRSRCPKPKRR